jgi:hypothetical protein
LRSASAFAAHGTLPRRHRLRLEPALDLRARLGTPRREGTGRATHPLRSARGLGETTIERLRAFARERQTSLYEALAEPSLIPQVNAGAQRRLSAFRALLGELQDEASRAPSAHAAVEAMFARTGLVKAYAAEGSEEALEKAENLRELSGAALEFDRLRAEAGAPPPAQPAEPEAGLPEDGPLQVSQTALEAFLEQISLVGNMDSDDASGRVALMTLHAVKGLEFDAVFLSGRRRASFRTRAPRRAKSTRWPIRSPTLAEEMGEERRLCYVGITRARRRLCFSLARSRALFGDLQLNEPSRFLSDIPPELFGLPAAPAAPSDGAEERPPGKTYVEREPELELDEGDGFFADEFDQRSEHERRSAPARAAAPPPAARPAPAARARAGPGHGRSGEPSQVRRGAGRRELRLRHERHGHREVSGGGREAHRRSVSDPGGLRGARGSARNRRDHRSRLQRRPRCPAHWERRSRD